jgi:hypothetical protein
MQTLKSEAGNGIQIVVPAGTDKVEVIIREGAAEEILKPMPPKPGDIYGIISAPRKFLEKRLMAEQFEQKDCNIQVNRRNNTITLQINERDHYNARSISGWIKENPKLEEFGINVKKGWEPNELGQFLKMNRVYFCDRTENLKLVTELKNFDATVNSRIEKQKNENGNFADNFSGTVTSNLPGSFKIEIPLYIGGPKEIIEVEFYATISGRDVKLELYSPDAVATFEEVRDDIINSELEQINNIAGGIVIIEI